MRPQESEDSFATDIYVENIPEDTPENGQRPSYGEEGFVDNAEEQLSPIGATWEKAFRQDCMWWEATFRKGNIPFQEEREIPALFEM